MGADGRPHVVPITFALDGDTLYTAVDHKPKRTTRLRRLENVAANPRVSVLADHYDEQDWSALWWVRADGVARILAPNDPQRARVAALLQARYEQYRRRPPTGPAIAISHLALERLAGRGRSARLTGCPPSLGAVGVRMQIWPAMPREQAGDSTTTPAGRAASQTISPGHFRAIVESADDAILSKDRNLVITSWNPAATRLYGYSAEEAIGQPMSILIPNDHAGEERDILQHGARGRPCRAL